MTKLAELMSRDYVPEADRERYQTLIAEFERELHPHGAVQAYLAAEIVRGAWRLQTLAQVDLSALDEAGLAAHTRAFNKAANSARWYSGELRRVQSNHEIQNRLGMQLPGLTDVRDLLKVPSVSHRLAIEGYGATKPAAAAASMAEVAADDYAREFAATRERAAAMLAGDSAPATASTPRNAACPCGSGRKHKRCCGQDAPAVLGAPCRLLAAAA